MSTGTHFSPSQALIRSLFYYEVSTGSEHDIFPFHAEWLSKGKELERFFKYIEELLSFSMDVKTYFVCLLFEVKKTLL
jgi:hypothetical protein